MPQMLIAEDQPATTVGTVGSLRGYGVRVHEARSLLAGAEVLSLADLDFATLDQRMPSADDEEHDASNEEVDEFARRLGEEVPFVWLTAHEVPPERVAIPGCVGVVPKAGDVTQQVINLAAQHVRGFEVRHGGVHLDQVLLELQATSDPARFTAQVLAWRPEPFEIRADLLPDWLRYETKERAGKPVFVKARAWLGARRHKQLDLCEMELAPTRIMDDREIWDDLA